MNTENGFLKQSEIMKVIGTHLRNVEYVTKYAKSFSLKNTVLLRSEIKKLKSFLHLLNMASGENIKVGIPKKLRELYNCAGIIFKLQVHLDNINTYCKTHSWPIPHSYKHQIANALESWKQKTTEAIDCKKGFEEVLREIESIAPQELNTDTINKFLDYTIFELKNLYALKNEETLADISKLLEDLLNNWSFIELYANALVKAFPSKENIKACLDLLNMFDKNCVDIALLRIYSEDGFPDWERKITDSIEQVLINENELLRFEICQKLEWISYVEQIKIPHAL
jgi:hypothetical protein